MPNRDGSGPSGSGPQTGRGAGNCTGNTPADSSNAPRGGRAGGNATGGQFMTGGTSQGQLPWWQRLLGLGQSGASTGSRGTGQGGGGGRGAGRGGGRGRR